RLNLHPDRIRSRRTLNHLLNPKPTPGSAATATSTNGKAVAIGGSATTLEASLTRGKPHRESSYSTDPAVALKKLDKHVKELWAAKQGLAAFVPKAEKVFVDELLDELEQHYKLNGGLAQFRSHLKPVRKAFGDLRAVDVTPKVVDDYIDDRLAGDTKAGVGPRSAATINRETCLLGQAFKLGVQRRLIVMAPHIRSPAENNVRQGFFENPEFEAVATHLPEYLQDFSRF